jgi:hypothetical protein
VTEEPGISDQLDGGPHTFNLASDVNSKLSFERHRLDFVIDIPATSTVKDGDSAATVTTFSLDLLLEPAE